MFCSLKNEALQVTVNTAGGELWSVRTTDGAEYLWQGDPAFWGGRAPNLFPFVARLVNGTYRLEGKTYQLNIHGFIKASELSAEQPDDQTLVLSMEDNEETRKQYPYHFRYQIIYHLSGSCLEVTIRVENRDSRIMYFGLGGHPGFHVPLEEGLSFEDYTLTFDEGIAPEQVTFSPDCFVTGRAQCQVIQGNQIPLSHGLFDNDAVVVEGSGHTVTLSSSKGSRAVTVKYPGMNYIGFWHMPHTEAPYVCIEPWVSLPARKDIIEDFAEKPDLVHLEAGKVYENIWTITIK